MADKLKDRFASDLDLEPLWDDLADDALFPEERERAFSREVSRKAKMTARRRLEIYLEKKRLLEQVGDLEESEIDF